MDLKGNNGVVITFRTDGVTEQGWVPKPFLLSSWESICENQFWNSIRISVARLEPPTDALEFQFGISAI